MFDEILQSGNIKKFDLESLLQLRLNYDLKIPEYVFCDEEKAEMDDEIVEGNVKFEMAEESQQEEVEICSDPLMMTLEGNLFDDQNLDFDIPTIMPPTLTIEQSFVKNEEKKDDADLRKFKCDQCNKRFKVRVHLQHHINSHLPDAEKFIHQCPSCEKKYSSTFCLRQHIKHVHEVSILWKIL
jgi:hypothetical protein